MVIKKMVTIPARSEYKIEKVFCDICKNECQKRYHDYTTSTACIMSLEESSGAEGGYSSSTIYDICMDCFKTKIVPYMNSLNAVCRNEEKEW